MSLRTFRFSSSVPAFLGEERRLDADSGRQTEEDAWANYKEETTMKGNIQRNAFQWIVFAGVLAACLFGSTVSAQSDFQGKFTLPHETQWGQTALPAGDYVLAFTHDGPFPMLVIREAKSSRVVAYESVDIRESNAKGQSALLVGRRGTQRVVCELRIAELNEAFVYERPPAQGGEVEARQTQAIPVLVAKK